jgi:hypothetical protein
MNFIRIVAVLMFALAGSQAGAQQKLARSDFGTGTS